MAEIEADPDSMRDVADELASAADGMDDELTALTENLDTLMHAWSGDAAEAYRTAQTGWGGSMTELHALLDSVSTLLSNIASRYEETEAAVIRDCA